ncbi:MAG: hypothetical protein R3A45_13280 [Bdellovibrionota bacterium]
MTDEWRDWRATAALVQNQNKRMNQEAANAYIEVIESLPQIHKFKSTEEAWNKFADATETYIDQYQKSDDTPR